MKGPLRPQMTHTGPPLRASSAQGAAWIGSGMHGSGKVGRSDRSGED
jgi:hypothetical protein